MDVREFVKRSLVDIIGGVVDAQVEVMAFAPDARISPSMARTEAGAALAAGRLQQVSMIEFDLAVTVTHSGSAEAAASGNGGILSVLGASAEGKVDYGQERSNASRIRFQVPLAMPRQGSAPSAGGEEQ